MTDLFDGLTRDEHCIAACLREMNERRVPPPDQYAFAAAFVAGWQERGIALAGEVRITREALADLERRAGVSQAHIYPPNRTPSPGVRNP